MHFEQVRRHIEQGFLNLLFAALEALAPEFVECDATVRADVLLGEVDLAGRNQQGHFVVEAEPEMVLGALATFHQLHAEEAGNAVHCVHDVVAGTKLEEALDRAARHCGAFANPSLVRHPGKLDIRQDGARQLGNAEAAADGPELDRDLFLCEVDLLVREDLQLALPFGVSAAQEQHASLQAAHGTQAPDRIRFPRTDRASRRQDLEVQVVTGQRRQR